MRMSLLCSVASIVLATATGAAFAQGEGEFPATLKGHAVLPAQSFVDAPADAPADLKTAGKYTSGRRVDAVGSVMGKSYGRPTGVSLPFKGQPLQGHSGIKVMANGSFWVLTDNGMGSRYNSPDSMLYLNRHKIDWATGKIDRQETIFLHDPDRKVPFRILHEDSAKRYLTGADFDTEGFQIIGDTFWIGDEFGPYVLKADKTGKVLAVFETMADGKPVRSPDHWSVQSPATPGASYTTVNLRRSKGYEGFAASKDGKFLYGLLEGPLWDAEKKDSEKVGGKEAARILEFDVAAEKFTGRYWQYVFEQNGHAIGDFNMIDATSGLIIERDNGEGTADKSCPQGTRGESCFPNLAKFKRIYKVELTDANVGKPARKIAYIDLMKIRDPDKKARKPLNDGVLTFPFFTIENVDRVDATHIVVGNDNNLPFSSSRDPNKADDNEFVLLEVGDFLKAK
jgi:hypothetical protein